MENIVGSPIKECRVMDRAGTSAAMSVPAWISPNYSRKKRALREIEERVALAAEAAHLGAWELDIDQNEVWVSDKARELFGFKPEEPMNYTEDFKIRVHPQDRAGRDSVVQTCDRDTGWLRN